MTPSDQQLLDSLARIYMEAALEQLLVEGAGATPPATDQSKEIGVSTI